jgi:hypothetical protein
MKDLVRSPHDIKLPRILFFRNVKSIDNSTYYVEKPTYAVPHEVKTHHMGLRRVETVHYLRDHTGNPTGEEEAHPELVETRLFVGRHHTNKKAQRAQKGTE